MDVTTDAPARVIAKVKPDVIVHLASIVTPPPKMGRAAAYAVDVEGTRKVMNAAIANGVRRLVVTSSGAAYGYHADNPVPLCEDDPLRGNPEFPYSDHKRQVEEILAEARSASPDLEQVILRVGTVLGAGTEKPDNRPVSQTAPAGSIRQRQPVCFYLDARSGTYPAARSNRRATRYLQRRWRWCDGCDRPGPRHGQTGSALAYVGAESRLGRGATARPVALRARTGAFLQNRPVLDNSALKSEFGYIPEKTSAEVFAFWQKQAGL